MLQPLSRERTHYTYILEPHKNKFGFNPPITSYNKFGEYYGSHKWALENLRRWTIKIGPLRKSCTWPAAFSSHWPLREKLSDNELDGAVLLAKGSYKVPIIELFLHNLMCSKRKLWMFARPVFWLCYVMNGCKIITEAPRVIFRKLTSKSSTNHRNLHLQTETPTWSNANNTPFRICLINPASGQQ